MIDKKVVVIDYGMGNLFSVRRALEHCGVARVCLSSLADDVASADYLILPGVGAFRDGILSLKQLGLIQPIKLHASRNKPLLGICLGMQMLATRGFEYGVSEGLGLIEGDVDSIAKFDKGGRRLKLPHIAWSPLHPGPSISWENSVLSRHAAGAAMYFVHSFHMRPVNPGSILAVATYGGHEIVAAVQLGNIIGCQFHPEKSGKSGLKLLSSFLAI